MNDTPAVAAPAAAPEAVAPAPAPAATPEPSGQRDAAPQAEKAPAKSLRDVIKESLSTARGDDDDGETTAPAPEATGDKSRVRDELGRFAPEAGKEPAPTSLKPEAAPKPTTAAPADAPARFSPDAKAAWATVPAPVQAEVTRAFKELETGIEGYRREMEPLKPYADAARQAGVTLPDALGRYVALEQMMDQNPMAAMEKILASRGISVRDYAAAVMGMPQDQQASAQHQVIRSLQQEIQELKQGFAQQRESELMQRLSTFASAKPRFAELEDEMANMIETGYARDLEDAYDKANRLIPAPAAAPALPPPDLTAQTRKGQLSPTGAPSNGSYPQGNGTVPPLRQAARSALASAGII